MEYIPYGEVFVEERNNSFSTNYLFNAKELDNETGLYYYGARYLDPTGAMWLSVDPVFHAGTSPYAYCLGNPVKLVDPDGRDIVGNTSSDATTLCGLINQQLTPYEGMIDGISDYFYVNGNNLDCRYENLSPILKQIKNCQKDGILDDQMANDLKDLLYGYTAGIASERSIVFSFASQQNNLVDYLYAENYGGGVCDPQYDPVTGNLTGNMECIINVPFLPNRGTPLELATHEIVGHGVNRLYDVPGADDVEAVKFSNIVRRLSGFGDRTLPHDGNQTRLRKMNPVDRAEIGTDSFWKKVVKEMDKKNK